jgi:hypothetical protein
VRFDLTWWRIEPALTDPPTYNWSYYDSVFARLAANNLQPLTIVHGCPGWACVRDNGPLYDERRADFARFMHDMALRYSQPPYNAHYWELWNEPDSAGGPGNQWGWGLHPDKYAQMLAAVYPAVKAVDPTSVIMNGGIAYDYFFNQGGPFNPDFLPDLLDHGAAQHLDAIAFHYYSNNAHGWTNVGVKANVLRALAAAHGSNLPLICTEAGMTSSPGYGSSDAAQARYVVQMNVHGAASGLQSQVWFTDMDYDSPSPNEDPYEEAGLIRRDYTRKPSHTAMQILSQEIGSGAFIRPLGPDDGVTGTLEGYRFRTTTVGRHVSVAWNNGAGTTTMQIPAAHAPDLLGGVTLYGQTFEPEPGPGGTLLVTVGPDPLYLAWRAPRFDDVPFDSWMYPYVEFVALRGIVSGYADSTFRPGNNTTRGQLSKIVVLAEEWPIDTTGGPHFLDVPTSHPFYPYIETAYNRGVISGYADGTFRPGNNLTRAQLCKIVVSAEEWPINTTGGPHFTDVPATNPFYAYVETAYNLDIITGYSCGPGCLEFRPGSSATRAQISKIIYNALNVP